MWYSYSAARLFLTCPRRYYHKYVKRDYKEKPSDAMERGIRIHDYLAKAVETGEPPKSIWTPDGLIERLHQGQAQTEVKYKPKINGRTYIGFVDVELSTPHRSLLIDWKTGQKRVDPLQADFYTAFKHAQAGDTIPVSVHFVYVDVKAGTTLQGDEHSLRRVENVVNQMEKEQLFDPRPCYLCRFCQVKTCEYNES